jgi:dTDP-4-amino-4,6-dideoxygalactose transaminase
MQESVPSLAGICRKRGVLLIEDCALALGAGTEEQRAGKFGDLAIFSFTKSDWCYGGGMVVSNSPEIVARLREIRTREFRAARKLSWLCGLLRRADFAANRPSHSSAASITGRSIQLLSGMGGGNFYDAGRFDSLLPNFAVRRAQQILSNLTDATSKRREIQCRLISALGSAAPALLLWPEPQLSETAAFVPIVVADGNAAEAMEQADRRGVTLRLAWPAYQRSEEGQWSDNLEWLAHHLLILEIHPDLSSREVERVSNLLRSLAARG